MLQRIQEIQNNNSYKLDKFLYQIEDRINNVDVQFCENLEMDIEIIQLNKDDCVRLYDYFIIFKMIAQIALNRIRNNNYYIQNACRTNDSLKMIYNENDREILNSKLNRLLYDKECKRDLLLYEFKWSIKNYLVIYTILKSNENPRSEVPYREKVVNLENDNHFENENDNGMNMVIYNADALLIKNPGIEVTYRDKVVEPERDKYLENKNSTNESNFWECPICDTINYRMNSSCKVCLNLEKDKFLENDKGMNTAIYNTDDALIKNPGIEVTYRDKVVDRERDKYLENKNSTNESNFWECPMCDSLNYLTNSNCQVCEEKRPGLENQPLESGNEQILNDNISQKPETEKVIDLRTRCYDTCDNADNRTAEDDTNKSEQLESPRPEETKWTCQKCTFANVNTDDKCKVCDSQGPSFDKWRCEQCTLINEKLAETCFACDAMNPFLKKCSICASSNVNEKYETVCKNCASKSQPSKNISAMDVDDDQSIRKSWHCQNSLDCNSDTFTHCQGCAYLHNSDCKCQKCAQTINKSSQEHACAIYKNEEGSKVFMKSLQVCLVCSITIIDEKEKFCRECRYKFYLCSNPKCVSLNGSEAEYCSSCGVKKHSGLINCNLFECHKDGKTLQMWQCPFKECMQFNFVTSSVCAHCACPKMYYFKYKCQSCGWIESDGRMCSKCESDCDPIS